jgi:hypothetical protein
MNYLIWVPLTIIWYVFLTILSFNHNNNDNLFSKTGLYLWLMGLYPMWVFVSKYSTRLIFDGMLYDSIIFLSYPITMILLGAGKTFSMVNYIGLCFLVLGFFLLKIGN